MHTRQLIYASKIRGIPRTFKGFWKVYWWRNFVEGSAKFRQRAAHGLRKTVLHTCSELFKLSKLLHTVHTCSQLFRTVDTCSHLFKAAHKPFHTCPHLFTTVHTSETTLFVQLQFLGEFSPWESCYLSILDLCWVKLHILAGLIDSFPTEFGMCSCNEIKMSIPLGAHA